MVNKEEVEAKATPGGGSVPGASAVEGMMEL